ncbi:MAG TPA: glucosyl-3-phosphoglycerate synthase [Candidatus Dormibacteraeota bacterium]
MPDQKGRPHLLIPVLRAQAAPRLLQVAEAIVRREGGAGHVLGVVEVPFGRPIAGGVTVARRYRALLQRITALERRERAGLGVQVRVAHSVPQAVREAAYENATDMILLEWAGPSGVRGQATSAVMEDLSADPPADLLLVKPGPHADKPVKSVLAPVRGGPSAALALRAAAAIADSAGARLTVMHVHEPRSTPERHQRSSLHFHELVEKHCDCPDAQVLEFASEHPGQAILDEARHHDVVVLGAYAELFRSPVLVGSRFAATVAELPGTLVLAKSARAAAPSQPAGEPSPFPLIRSAESDLSTMVDRWFAENTYHSREFRDVARLVELKREQGLKISLGLPTLNEAPTIGKILRIAQDELQRDHPLLDEIVVIDSGSSDQTVAIAKGMGVPVYDHRELVPELGSFAGKGEALWKSLYVLDGDIVVWCDTDVSNFHPQFVYGVLGPLLTDQRIGYVKGFYRRPLNFPGQEHTAGGGRVTELAARPLINLFYPDLSGLLQPLSGEYAGRRELLERLPFFTGYGVEMGHLIDILENFGLNRIAQVDLGIRIHRNQELFDLSKMAFAIMQVALKRLGDRHRMHLLEEVNRSMKLIHYTNDRFFLEVKEIVDWERPPMTMVPEYLLRRHSADRSLAPSPLTGEIPAV